MDEKRPQAYINLIEQLLICADDEERTNILQANMELIDPQFLQMMENYATNRPDLDRGESPFWGLFYRAL